MKSIVNLYFYLILLLPANSFASSICGSAGNALCGSGWDASAFNVVTLGVVGGPNPNSGNFTPSSSVGGRVAVFGNFTGNGSQIGSQGYNPVSEHYTLVVNGSILTNPFTVGTGFTAAAVYVRGSHPAFNSPQVAVNDVPVDFDFTSARNSLQSFSTGSFSSGATTPSVSDNGTNYYISVNGGSGTKIYNVDASFFTNQNRGFEVDLNNTAASVVINVINAGSSLNIQKGTAVKVNGIAVAYNTSAGDPVLFNFSTVTSLNIANGDFAGSLLAPFATFTSTHGFNGQLIVASVQSLGVVHDIYYSGALPSASTTVPEPSSWLAFTAGGMLLVGFARIQSSKA